jgi:hypothetical protein
MQQFRGTLYTEGFQNKNPVFVYQPIRHVLFLGKRVTGSTNLPVPVFVYKLFFTHVWLEGERVNNLPIPAFVYQLVIHVWL